MLQYVEGLSDRQAADAVRGRIDWKCALGLSLTDPGFDHTVLSEFRTRLLTGKAERLLLDMLLQRLAECGLVKPRGRQLTNSTHVLADVRRLNRLVPSEQLVDKGYTASHVLVDSRQQHGVTIIGPVADDPSWQARSGDGLGKSQSW